MCSFHVSSLEDFTAAMDAVNVDLDEMRARAALLQTLLLPFYKQWFYIDRARKDVKPCGLTLWNGRELEGERARGADRAPSKAKQEREAGLMFLRQRHRNRQLTP